MTPAASFLTNAMLAHLMREERRARRRRGRVLRAVTLALAMAAGALAATLANLSPGGAAPIIGKTATPQYAQKEPL